MLTGYRLADHDDAIALGMEMGRILFFDACSFRIRDDPVVGGRTARRHGKD